MVKGLYIFIIIIYNCYNLIYTIKTYGLIVLLGWFLISIVSQESNYLTGHGMVLSVTYIEM